VPEPYERVYDAIPGSAPYPRTSRYHDVEIAVHTRPDGTEVRYVRHRLLPPLPARGDTVAHVVSSGERPDHLGQQYIGDPGKWWLIADANPVLDPYELTAEPGRSIAVPRPGGVGRA
jgi:hypothetical protein